MSDAQRPSTTVPSATRTEDEYGRATHPERINPGDHPAAAPGAAFPGGPPVPAERGERKPYSMRTKGTHDGVLYKPGEVVWLFDDQVDAQHAPVLGDPLPARSASLAPLGPGNVVQGLAVEERARLRELRAMDMLPSVTEMDEEAALAAREHLPRPIPPAPLSDDERKRLDELRADGRVLSAAETEERDGLAARENVQADKRMRVDPHHPTDPHRPVDPHHPTDTSRHEHRAQAKPAEQHQPPRLAPKDESMPADKKK